MTQLCAHLGHAANGWSATRRVPRLDGGTLDVCEMCGLTVERAREGRLGVNCRDRVVWVDLTKQELLDAAPPV